MTTVAIVPARGGSKGIPRKNLAMLGGRPLVVHSIEQALACAGIDRVVVSTDDDEIAVVAAAAGAEIVRRPAAISGDTASTESAIEHALSCWRADGWQPDRIVLLQATSPFRAPGQLDAALTEFERSGCDSMLSVVRYCGFVWRTDAQGQARPCSYDPGTRPRRQEIHDTWLETGSFYAFTRELFERTGARLGGRIATFAVPEADALDIDEPADLERARAEAARRGLVAPGELAGFDWLLLDVDGTLTDGAMYYGEGGDELKRFDTRDGAGIGRFKASGGRVALFTGERSQAAARRAEKLAIDHVVIGCRDKAAAFEELCRRFRVAPERVIAIGDDLNDLPLVGRVGMFVATADARPEVRAAADWSTTARGGHGAVRELTDRLVAA
ncbi:MAG: acylneuraminate cytidylyltransferase, partial [Deltaproteobacteria bacterium]|nr:acylneuraminate cytidylyltransferase [Nannocystaceae bacterium]